MGMQLVPKEQEKPDRVAIIVQAKREGHTHSRSTTVQAASVDEVVNDLNEMSAERLGGPLFGKPIRRKAKAEKSKG